MLEIWTEIYDKNKLIECLKLVKTDEIKRFDLEVILNKVQTNKPVRPYNEDDWKTRDDAGRG